MKRLSYLLFAAGLVGLSIFAALAYNPKEKAASVEFNRVVSLNGSASDAWLAAGGELVGVSDDAIERGLAVGSAQSVGSVARPSLEKILSLNPDLVLINPDIPNQLALEAQLKSQGISVRCDFSDTFEQYVSMMEEFLSLTGRGDLRERLIDEPAEQVEFLRKSVKDRSSPKVLLLRANSTGLSAKADGTVAAEILKDLKAVNIAAQKPSLLQELSREIILEQDPDFILVVPQGIDDAQPVIESLEPFWKSLSGRFVALPKELFHYKPNQRWGEAYARLAQILYP